MKASYSSAAQQAHASQLRNQIAQIEKEAAREVAQAKKVFPAVKSAVEGRFGVKSVHRTGGAIRIDLYGPGNEKYVRQAAEAASKGTRIITAYPAR